MDYHDRVEFRVLDRPTAHSVSFKICVGVVPMMAPFEWRLTGAWASFGVPGNKEYVVTYLPTLATSHSSPSANRAQSNAASALHLYLLKPGTRSSTTTEWTYIFQINLGLYVNVLERFLPDMRIEATRRHRALVASFKRHFASQVQAWLNDVEDDYSWRDAMVEEMRQGGRSYSEAETALIANGMAELDAFGKGKGKVQSLKHCKTVKTAQFIQNKKTGRLVGEVECLIRASPEQIVAYLMHFESKIRKSQLSIEVVRHEMLEVKSLHHAVVLSESKAGPGLPNLAAMNAVLWQKVADAPLTYIWVAVPMNDHPEIP